MGECSTLSQNLPSGSGLCGIKRSNDSSDEAASCSTTTKFSKFDSSDNYSGDDHRLIVSPVRHTDPGSETEFTYQENETDYCCRSNGSTTDWSNRSDRTAELEYEIRSPKEGPKPFGDSSTESDASVNALSVLGLPPPKNVDEAGNSGCPSSSSSDVFDPEIPKRDYWTCLRCKNISNRPQFRYCEKCYKVRRDMFQPRLKPRKRRKRKSFKSMKTARNFTSGKVNSERTTNVKNFQPDSTTVGGTVEMPGISRTSSATNCEIQLKSCAQENRDSGVNCSQSTVTSSLPPRGKDSDASLSPDSGADSRNFNGIKLLITKVSPLKVSSLPLVSRQRVDASESLGRVICQGVDSVPCAGQSVDEVDFVSPSQGIDEVDFVQPCSSQAVDEIDSVEPGSSQSADKVDSIQAQLRQDFHGVKSTSSQTVEEIDLVPSAVNQGGGKVSVSKLCSVTTQTDLSSVSKDICYEICDMCFSRPLDGVFVHSIGVHMCCCYKCAVKVWKTLNRCPLCNCKVMNVQRLFRC